MKLLVYILISMLIVSLNGCVSIPFNTPPQPSGQSQIGTQSIELVDLNRMEWFTENTEDFRRIIIQFGI